MPALCGYSRDGSQVAAEIGHERVWAMIGPDVPGLNCRLGVSRLSTRCRGFTSSDRRPRLWSRHRAKGAPNIECPQLSSRPASFAAMSWQDSADGRSLHVPRADANTTADDPASWTGLWRISPRSTADKPISPGRWTFASSSTRPQRSLLLCGQPPTRRSCGQGGGSAGLTHARGLERAANHVAGRCVTACLARA